jgi:hypothetical protein
MATLSWSMNIAPVLEGDRVGRREGKAPPNAEVIPIDAKQIADEIHDRPAVAAGASPSAIVIYRRWSSAGGRGWQRQSSRSNGYFIDWDWDVVDNRDFIDHRRVT